MDNYPLISIITPTYNIIDRGLVDDFNILTTLLSKQSYPNIEHIIIDKASKDGTIQLLTDYKSKGYLQFYTEPDSGKFDALNKGIMHSNGDFIAFLNPGDFIHDIMALEEIITQMINNNAAYSFGTSYALHPEGYILPFEPAILNAFQVIPCALQAMVFAKPLLAAENYFDTRFKTMADFDLVMRIIMKEYPGILYDKNYVTYKISKSAINQPSLSEAEARQVYIKNFRSIYPLNSDIVDKITKYSEFPHDLLEKLSVYFPEEYREDFFKACEEMHKLRSKAWQRQENSDNQITGTYENSQITNNQSNQILEQNTQSVSPKLSQQNISDNRQLRQTNPQIQPRFKMPGNP